MTDALTIEDRLKNLDTLDKVEVAMDFEAADGGAILIDLRSAKGRPELADLPKLIQSFSESFGKIIVLTSEQEVIDELAAMKLGDKVYVTNELPKYLRDQIDSGLTLGPRMSFPGMGIDNIPKRGAIRGSQYGEGRIGKGERKSNKQHRWR